MWPVQWVVDPGLQTKYADCPAPVRDMVEGQHAAEAIIPFRRRDFAANAMVREALSRAGQTRLWGQSLPPSAALTNAQTEASRNVFTICEQSTGAEVSAELRASLRRTSPVLRFVNTLEGATHVLIVLTRGAGSVGSATLVGLEAAVQLKKKLVFVYQTRTDACPGGWSFEDNDADAKLDDLLKNNEAMVYRAPAASTAEHRAMVLEMLRRMQPLVPTAAGERNVAPMSLWGTGPPATQEPHKPKVAFGHTIGSIKRHKVVPSDSTRPQEEKTPTGGPPSKGDVAVVFQI